jgi:hypothetical protein
MGSIGFISFLWWAEETNNTWLAIADAAWMTKSVTLISVILRASISLQATVTTSMLAGLMLERGEVILHHLASISSMRNSNPGPYNLAYLTLVSWFKTGCSRKQILSTVLLILLSTTTLALQFTSTALLFDIKPGLIPGYATPIELL